MEFHELGSWKDTVSKTFFQSELLREIVMPTLDNDKYDEDDNWFGGKKLPIYISEKPTYSDLIGHFFDVPFVDGTVTDTRMVLCVDTEVAKCEGEALKSLYVHVYVMCHKDFIKMTSTEKSSYKKNHQLAGNRIDMAVEVIGRLLNGSKKFGLGRLQPIPNRPVTSYSPNNEFFGKVLHYICDDFRTDYAVRSVNGE